MNKYNKLGHIFFICGITGSGKGTLIKSLVETNQGLSLVQSVKTRDLRDNEIDGVDYIKYSIEEFKKGIENNIFLEYDFLYNKDYYGSRKKDLIENGILKGKNIVKEIGMNILPTLKELLEDYKDNYTIIYLDLPEYEMKNRMIARGEDITSGNYEQRLKDSRKEKEMIDYVDYIIQTDTSKKEVYNSAIDIIQSKI